jgi:hypothetical protein
MNALLKDALPTIEGKGGGNKKSARGKYRGRIAFRYPS